MRQEARQVEGDAPGMHSTNLHFLIALLWCHWHVKPIYIFKAHYLITPYLYHYEAITTFYLRHIYVTSSLLQGSNGQSIEKELLERLEKAKRMWSYRKWGRTQVPMPIVSLEQSLLQTYSEAQQLSHHRWKLSEQPSLLHWPTWWPSLLSALHTGRGSEYVSSQLSPQTNGEGKQFH